MVKTTCWCLNCLKMRKKSNFRNFKLMHSYNFTFHSVHACRWIILGVTYKYMFFFFLFFAIIIHSCYCMHTWYKIPPITPKRNFFCSSSKCQKYNPQILLITFWSDIIFQLIDLQKVAASGEAVYINTFP